ncbi:MAG: hypothetical protein K2W33_08285 [Burkholderiales bacterium]|nr:hypothetical protein [Burkholderiales bacterium]
MHAVTDEGHTKETAEQFSRVDQHSSYPAMSRSTFEHVNLLELIDPKGESIASRYSQVWSKPKLDGNGNASDITIGQRYDLVLSWFTDQPEVGDWKRQRRNSVQDKILAVSTSRCNVFKTYLRRQQVEVNFTLGSLTTAAGVLGAVLPGVTASRNLAGAAGLFSGLRSEYNQSYYSNLAAHVIVQGIELRQNRLKKELVEARQNKSVAEYSMEAAINDAIVIDGNCSTVAGLIEAQESIREVESPGLKTAARVMASQAALRELGQTTSTELLKDGKLDKLVAIAGADVPAMLVTSTRMAERGNPAHELAQASNAEARIQNHIAHQAAVLVNRFEALQQQAKNNNQPQSSLKPEEVTTDFTGAVNKLILSAENQKALSLCVNKLGEPTAKLGAATAKLSLAPQHSEARINALSDIDKARADVNAAIARVEHMVDAAHQATNRLTQLALLTLKSKANATDGLKGLSKASTLLDGTQSGWVAGGSECNPMVKNQ